MAEKTIKRILLVEDDAMLQYVFDKQIRKLGFEVSEIIGDGVDAVNKVLTTDPYDVIFMDVALPGIDGIAATKQIRALEPTRGVRSLIIGLTAFAERERCIAAGMDDFLQKPITLEELQEKIDKWILTSGRAPEVHHPINSDPSITIKSDPSITIKSDPSIDIKDFAQRNDKLKSIQEKIAKLRKNLELY